MSFIKCQICSYLFTSVSISWQRRVIIPIPSPTNTREAITTVAIYAVTSVATEFICTHGTG